MSKWVMFAEIPVQTNKYVLQDIAPSAQNGKWPKEVIDYCTTTITLRLCRINVDKKMKEKAVNGPLPCSSIFVQGVGDLKAILLAKGFAAAKENTNEEEHKIPDNYYEYDVEELFVSNNEQSTSEMKNHPQNNNSQISLSFFKNTEDHLDPKNVDNQAVHMIDIEDDVDFDALSISASTSFNETSFEPIIEFIKSKYTMFPLNDSMTNFCSKISAVLTPSILLIAPSVTSYEELYDEMMIELQKEAHSLPPCVISKHMPCIAYRKKEKVWYRAVIISDSPNNSEQFEVVFVDYFNREHLEKKYLKYCPDKYINKYPLLLTEVKIYGIKLNRRMREVDILERLKQVTRNKGEVWVRLGRFDLLPEVEIYTTNRMSELVYASLIEEGFYSKVNYF